MGENSVEEPQGHHEDDLEDNISDDAEDNMEGFAGEEDNEDISEHEDELDCDTYDLMHDIDDVMHDTDDITSSPGRGISRHSCVDDVATNLRNEIVVRDHRADTTDETKPQGYMRNTDTLLSSNKGDVELLGQHPDYRLEAALDGSERRPKYFRIGRDFLDPDTILCWLAKCDTEHDCLPNDAASRTLKKPSKLTFVDVVDQCLVELNQEVPYVCLSYVWGRNAAFATTSENVISLHQRGALLLPGVEMPRTISDAIELTRTLRFRYLWVDRFCIVQDDEEAREVFDSMASIYAYSTFTMVAATGVNDDCGLPGVSPRKLIQPILNFDGTKMAMNINEELERDDVWHSRAWTFQERLLSKRCLVFHGDTFLWECGQSVWSELAGNSHLEIGGKQLLDVKRGPDWR